MRELQDADPYYLPSAAALTTRRALSEASTSTVGRVAFVLLIGVVTSGCGNHSFNEVRRPVTRPELQRAEAEPSVSSRSDRLRGGWPTAETPTPARAPEPAHTQERAQPQEPARPSEATPPRRGTDEPDPRAVIDWLLKDRR